MKRKVYKRLEMLEICLNTDVLTVSPAIKVYGAGDDNGASDIDWFFE